MSLGVVDIVLSLLVVALAIAWLVTRFVRPKKRKAVSGPNDVIVGASLARGLAKARARQDARPLN